MQAVHSTAAEGAIARRDKYGRQLGPSSAGIITRSVVGWLVGVGLVLGLLASHTYPTGAYVDLPGGHWCGIELAPTSGLFCDTD